MPESRLTLSGELSDVERTLMRAAETQPWTWALRANLALAVERRGFQVHEFDSPGDLADFLRQWANPRPSVAL